MELEKIKEMAWMTQEEFCIVQRCLPKLQTTGLRCDYEIESYKILVSWNIRGSRDGPASFAAMASASTSVANVIQLGWSTPTVR